MYMQIICNSSYLLESSLVSRPASSCFDIMSKQEGAGLETKSSFIVGTSKSNFK